MTCIPSFLTLTSIHTWEREFISSVGRSISSSSGLGFGILFLLNLAYVIDTILHQDEVSILIWSLMRLLFLNSFVQKVNSFVILFLQLCLNALILYILKSVHLISHVLWIKSHLWHLNSRLGSDPTVGNSTRIVIAGCTRESISLCLILCILSSLALFCKFDVIFVKNDFLNVIGWNLLHEETL